MAEIRVEKKKGVPIWAILLGLILLAALVWAFLSGRDDAQDAQENVGRLERSAPVISIILTEHAPAPEFARCA
jgi:type VI protein secretion system component VasF